MFIKGTLNIETKHFLENYNCMNVGLYSSSSFRFLSDALFALRGTKEGTKINSTVITLKTARVLKTLTPSNLMFMAAVF